MQSYYDDRNSNIDFEPIEDILTVFREGSENVFYPILHDFLGKNNAKKIGSTFKKKSKLQTDGNHYT